jgi:hypothetical protein
VRSLDWRKTSAGMPDSSRTSPSPREFVPRRDDADDEIARTGFVVPWEVGPDPFDLAADLGRVALVEVRERRIAGWLSLI